VVELAREDLERISIKDEEQLVLGEPEQILQFGGRAAQNGRLASRPEASPTPTTLSVRSVTAHPARGFARV
jgi:hypothetical protein